MRSAILLILLLVQALDSVDRTNFKTCQQAAFCKRQRERQQPQKWLVVGDSVDTNGKTITFKLKEATSGVELTAELTNLKAGQIVRLKVKESESPRLRFDATEEVLLPKCCQPSNFTVRETTDSVLRVAVGDGNEVQVKSDPFRMELLSRGQYVMSVNQRDLFKFEHYRIKDDPNNDCSGDGCWEESFKSHTDTKPYGPMSVGMDVTFVNMDHVYGIPEHSDRLLLRNTHGAGVHHGDDPYRLYNVDIFEYEAESTMALYGSVPMMVGHNKERTVGLLWLNPSETWIDIESSSSGSFLSNIISPSDSEKHKLTHWMSETGIIDVFFMLGPGPKDVMAQNAHLTGVTPLPPLYSIGHHQCRWNYWSSAEVNDVDVATDDHDIPMDAIWLDIEYTEGRSKKYFTWDPVTFGDAKTLVSNLTAKGRRLITIIDPHIKKDTNYHVYNEAVSNKLFIKDKNDNDYEGWCWPGSSYWPDYLNPAVRDWWSEKFQPNHFPGFDGIVDIWNDMNEPSVFNGPEVTAPRDLKHYGGFEHRDIHNIYGYLMVKATFDGLTRYRENLRPFVLTRSYFAGSQRYCAAWSGDNMAKWEFLKMTIPLTLTNSLVGISFFGSDVPGFFFNPESEELVIRWYQTAVLQPFFRAHAHLDTKRREPWTFSEGTKLIIRDAVRLRFSYLPYMYTMFFENEMTGVPVNRPLWMEFPTDSETFAIDDTFMLGEALLVAPVQQKDQVSVDVYLPGDDTTSWVNRESLEYLAGGRRHKVSAPIHSIPHFQRSGTIIVKRDRTRRSALIANNDPIVLDVVLDAEGKASGRVYHDDGQTFNYRKGEFIYGNVNVSKKIISYEPTSAPDGRVGKYASKVWLERINVFGWPSSGQKPSRIVVQVGDKSSNLHFMFDASRRLLVIRKPGVAITGPWMIRIV